MTLKSSCLVLPCIRKWATKHSIVRSFMKLASLAAKRPLCSLSSVETTSMEHQGSRYHCSQYSRMYRMWLCSKIGEDSYFIIPNPVVHQFSPFFGMIFPIFPMMPCNNPKSSSSSSASSISPIFCMASLGSQPCGPALPMPRVAPVMMATWHGDDMGWSSKKMLDGKYPLVN